MPADPKGDPGSSQLPQEVWADVPGLAARAGMRLRNPEVLAAGPLEVELVVESRRSDNAFYLAIGGSTSARRPAFVSFTASLEGGSNIELGDPFSQVPEIGGPVSAIPVAFGAPATQTVLVNEFVRLEKVRQILHDGEKAALQVRCRRALLTGHDVQQAIRPGANSQTVELAMRMSVRRDDNSLVALIERLSNSIRGEWNVYAASRHHRSLAQLAAMRVPEAVPYLQALTEHPDAGVRTTIFKALESTSN